MDNNFAHIIEKNKLLIFKVCRIYTHNENEFQELFQEIMIQIWKSLEKFRGEAQLSTWIYRLAINTALSHKTLTAKRKEIFGFDENFMNAIPIQTYNFERDAQVEQLLAAVAQLKPIDKAIITLYLEERSYDEIADIVGISKSNVGVRINRAKEQLYKIMKGTKADATR
jgi:RNA polymerase sigma-70 factor (ECF subfamily)